MSQHFSPEVYREVAQAFNVEERHLRSSFWAVCTQSMLSLSRCADLEFTRRVVVAEMPQVEYNISPLCSEAQSCPRTANFILKSWYDYKRETVDPDYWEEKKVQTERRLLASVCN